MRYWIYAEPAGLEGSEPAYCILSDKAILESYYTYWSGKMDLAGKAHLANDEDCILDWVSTHWATEVTAKVLEQFISAPNADNSTT